MFKGTYSHDFKKNQFKFLLFSKSIDMICLMLPD